MTPRSVLWAALAVVLAAPSAEAQCRIVNGRMVCSTNGQTVVERSGLFGLRRTVRYVQPAPRYSATTYASPRYSVRSQTVSSGSYGSSGASYGGSTSYTVATPVYSPPAPKPVTNTDAPVVASKSPTASCCDDCDDLRAELEGLKQRVEQLEVQSGFRSGAGASLPQVGSLSAHLPPADRLLALCRPPVIPEPRVLIASR